MVFRNQDEVLGAGADKKINPIVRVPSRSSEILDKIVIDDVGPVRFEMMLPDLRPIVWC